jgi:hypothetical protein
MESPPSRVFQEKFKECRRLIEESDQLAKVKRIVDEFPPICSEKDATGSVLLHYAAMYGRNNTLQYLVNRSDINAQQVNLISTLTASKIKNYLFDSLTFLFMKYLAIFRFFSTLNSTY